jgi:hypothetical protein
MFKYEPHAPKCYNIQPRGSGTRADMEMLGIAMCQAFQARK